MVKPSCLYPLRRDKKGVEALRSVQESLEDRGMTKGWPRDDRGMTEGWPRDGFQSEQVVVPDNIWFFWGFPYPLVMSK